MMMNNCLEKFPGGRLVGQRSMNFLMAFDSNQALLLSKRVEPVCNAFGSTNVLIFTQPSPLWMSLFFFSSSFSFCVLNSRVGNGVALSVVSEQLALRHLPSCLQLTCALFPPVPRYSATSTAVSNRDGTAYPQTRPHFLSRLQNKGRRGAERRGPGRGSGDRGASGGCSKPVRERRALEKSRRAKRRQSLAQMDP